jgi:hypothetical protein
VPGILHYEDSVQDDKWGAWLQVHRTWERATHRAPLEVAESAAGGGQVGAEVGVGDVDELLGALADGAAVEGGDAVFGDDVVDVVAGGDDAGAFVEHGDDAADGVVFGGGEEGDDGQAVFGAGGAADEVELAADAAVEAGTDGVGADLAGQIDLDRRVDGDHAVVLGDVEGIVDVVGGVHLDNRIVVNELV